MDKKTKAEIKLGLTFLLPNAILKRSYCPECGNPFNSKKGVLVSFNWSYGTTVCGPDCARLAYAESMFKPGDLAFKGGTRGGGTWEKMIPDETFQNTWNSLHGVSLEERKAALSKLFEGWTKESLVERMHLRSVRGWPKKAAALGKEVGWFSGCVWRTASPATLLALELLHGVSPDSVPVDDHDWFWARVLWEGGSFHCNERAQDERYEESIRSLFGQGTERYKTAMRQLKVWREKLKREEQKDQEEIIDANE